MRRDRSLARSRSCFFGRRRPLVQGARVGRKKVVTKNRTKDDVPERRKEGFFVTLLTVDHSARESMKDAASCEMWCELQSTLIVDNLNVHYGMRSRFGRCLVRLSVRSCFVSRKSASKDGTPTVERRASSRALSDRSATTSAVEL